MLKFANRYAIDDYLSNRLSYDKFYNLNKRVFSIRNEIGNVYSLQSSDVADSNKFSLGGRTLRGFDIYGVGPRNSSTSYVGGNNNNPKLLIDQKDMLGKWTDVLVNAKWTNKKDGFFKVWVNGKLKAQHTGMTQEKIDDMLFHIGIYRSFLSKTPGPDPTQVAYYDEVRHGNKCKKLKLKELGYSCKDIESQIFK